jgi:hypothetical protein
MDAESGLSRQRVSLWIYAGPWRLEDPKTLLAQSRWTYDLRKGHLHEVSEPILSATPLASPQREWIELDEEQ